MDDGPSTCGNVDVVEFLQSSLLLLGGGNNKNALDLYTALLDPEFYF
jgi:hypothetical protein